MRHAGAGRGGGFSLVLSILVVLAEAMFCRPRVPRGGRVVVQDGGRGGQGWRLVEIVTVGCVVALVVTHTAHTVH